MGSGIFYSRIAKSKQNVKKRRFIKTLFLAGVLLFGWSLNLMAAPIFAGVHTFTITVCQDITVPFDISGQLGVNDNSTTGTDTWSTAVSPSAGTLVAAYSTNPTGLGTMTPAPGSITYIPNAGAYGADIFKVMVSNGTTSDTVTVFVTINKLPSIVLGAFPALCAGASTATISFTGQDNIGTIHNVFPEGSSIWTVPEGVTSVQVDALGAAGGLDTRGLGADSIGKGGRVQGILSVIPGQWMSINVGGAGSAYPATGSGGGGFNGGGNVYYPGPGAGGGGGGGGATDIRMNGFSLADRVLVAGGGGGIGANLARTYRGGDGGGLIGQNSADNPVGSHAEGGGQNAFTGAPAVYFSFSGSHGSLGNGGDGSSQGNSGGGGGGYYGGGGGVWNGGGGGSSYTDPTYVSLVTHTQGYNPGAGLLAIDYTIPGTYTIDWSGDANAVADGFVNDVNMPFPVSASAFSVAIPATVTPGRTYHAMLTLTSNTTLCASAPIPIVITINPLADIDPTSIQDMAVCQGDASLPVAPVTISGTPATFEWTNDNIYIGLSGSGSGNLPSFTATNATTDPITSVISFTATTTDGCVSPPGNFFITVNPKPKLSTATEPTACNLALFSYPAASLTAGTTFSWSRDSVADFSNAPASGFGDVNEVLVNLTPFVSNVIYAYTLTANGCSLTQDVTLSVNPTPILSSTVTPAPICDKDVFNYTPTSLTPDVSFAWERVTVPGLTNTTASGTGNPMESLENVYTAPIAVNYVYTLTVNTTGIACTNTEVVSIIVNPLPMLTSAHLAPPVCSGGLFTYTPTSSTSGATFQWDRHVVYGIDSSGHTAPGSVSDVLIDTVGVPVLVTYGYRVIANGCYNYDSIHVLVNPAPGLSSSLNPAAVCSNSPFDYSPTSTASGVTFQWIRGAVAGISNSADTHFGSVSESLINTTANPISVPYAFITSGAGCVNSRDTVRVTVNPTPHLSSTLTPTFLCDSTFFSYVPTSGTFGATYRWSRAYVSGVPTAATSGIGAVNELIENPTNVPVTVTYVYTVSANGCDGTDDVVLAVNPRPRISSPLAAHVCSGTPFSYTPTSFTPGTKFDWTRPIVDHINPETAFGVGDVLETLISSVPTDSVVTMYNFRLTANGCVNNNIQHLMVTVHGTPPNVNIVTNTPANICSHSMYENFGISVPQPAGVRYDWMGFNAQIYSLTQGHQYALVSFLEPGAAWVEVTSVVERTGCITKNSLAFYVGAGVADNPRVVYYNQQFVCLQTNVDSYQWGYDDDATLNAVTLEGEINASYNNSYPDLNHRHYWVKVTHNGCTSKMYYNKPTGVEQVQAGEVAQLKVFPNPVNDIVNVEIKTTAAGNMQVEVLDMLGQRLNMVPAVDKRAGIDVASLPAGCYLVNCYNEGVKIASSRFIKN